MDKVRTAVFLITMLGAAFLISVVAYVIGKYLLFSYEASVIDRKMSGVALLVFFSGVVITLLVNVVDRIADKD